MNTYFYFQAGAASLAKMVCLFRLSGWKNAGKTWAVSVLGFALGNSQFFDSPGVYRVAWKQ